jgi:hypothetical protein
VKEFSFEKLNPTSFTFDQYTLKVGYNISDAFIVDSDTFRLKEGFVIIGYCDAGLLHIRPRPGNYAIKILCLETDEIFWMHLMDFQMEYLEENEKKCSWRKQNT